MPSQKGQVSNGPERPANAERPQHPSTSPHTPVQPASAGPNTPSPRAPEFPAASALNRRSPGWYAARCLEEMEAAERRPEPPSRPANADELVAQFMDCASTDAALAEEYIQNNGWELEVALQQFWRAMHPESSDDGLSELGSGDSGCWEKSEDEGEKKGEGQAATAPRRGKGCYVRKAAKGKKRSFAAENPNVDRSAAVRGQRDESRLTITLMRNGQQSVSEYGHVVDWSNASHIMRLNKWRQQVFRRNLNTVRAGVHAYLPEEDQYLVDVHQAALQANGGRPRRLSLDWDAVVGDFNAHFAGRVLDGSGKPRPKRTKGSLQSQAQRLPEVAELTGKNPRSTKQGGDAEEGPTPPPKRDGKDNGDDEDRPAEKL